MLPVFILVVFEVLPGGRHLRLAQLADNLLSRELFAGHFDLSSFTNPNLKVGSAFGGQVRFGIHDLDLGQDP